MKYCRKLPPGGFGLNRHGNENCQFNDENGDKDVGAGWSERIIAS